MKDVIKHHYLILEVQVEKILDGLVVVVLSNALDTIMFWFMIRTELSLVLRNRPFPIIHGLDIKLNHVKRLVHGMVMNVKEKILQS